MTYYYSQFANSTVEELERAVRIVTRYRRTLTEAPLDITAPMIREMAWANDQVDDTFVMKWVQGVLAGAVDGVEGVTMTYVMTTELVGGDEDRRVPARDALAVVIRARFPFRVVDLVENQLIRLNRELEARAMLARGLSQAAVREMI